MCKCCEYIKDLQEIEDRHKEIPGIKHIIKARITTITRRKGVRRDVGVIDWKAFPLNYCPKCRTKTSRRWTKIGRKEGD